MLKYNLSISITNSKADLEAITLAVSPVFTNTLHVWSVVGHAVEYKSFRMAKFVSDLVVS